MPSLNYYHEEYARMEHERRTKRLPEEQNGHIPLSERRWGVNGSEYYSKEKARTKSRGTKSGLDPELLEKHLEGRKSRHKNRKTKERSSSKYYFDSSGSEEEQRLYEQLAQERKNLSKIKIERVKEGSGHRRRRSVGAPQRSRTKIDSSEDFSDDASQQSRRHDNLKRINKNIDAFNKSTEDLLEQRPKSRTGDRKTRTLPNKGREKREKSPDRQSKEVRSTRVKEREIKTKEKTQKSSKHDGDSSSKTHRRTKSRDNILASENLNDNNNNVGTGSLPKPKQSPLLYVKPIETRNQPTETKEHFISNSLLNNGISERAKIFEKNKPQPVKFKNVAEPIERITKFEDRRKMSHGKPQTEADFLSRSVDNIMLQQRNYEIEKKRAMYNRTPVSVINDITLQKKVTPEKAPEIPRLPSQESTTSTSSNISHKLHSLKEPIIDDTSDASRKEPAKATYMKRINWKRKPKVKGENGETHSETEIEVKEHPIISKSAPVKREDDKESVKDFEEVRKMTASPFLRKSKKDAKEVLSEPESRMQKAKKSPFIRRRHKKADTKTMIQYRPSDLGYPKINGEKPKSSDKERVPSINGKLTTDDNVSIGSRSSNNTTSTSTDISSRLSSQRNGSLNKYGSERSNEIIFTVNLDNNKSKPANQQTNKIFFTENVLKSRTSSTSSSHLQNNKWIQTSGPPIRAPPSEAISTQTTLNPLLYKTGKTQVNPWNFKDHLFHCATQTEKKTCEMSTQTTPEPEHKEMSTQCIVKEFTTSDTQTANPVMCDAGMVAVATTATMETQTAEEGSKIWGSAVSLDRLIRSRAMQRSRSVPREEEERGRSRSRSVGRLNSTGEELDTESVDQEMKSGKISSYSWSQTNKFVKLFVSYSGVHLIPTNLITVKTNGINLSLSIKEPLKERGENGEMIVDKSSLKLCRLMRPVSALSYTVQRDMITIMLRKQKALEWATLLYGQGGGSLVPSKSVTNLTQ